MRRTSSGRSGFSLLEISVSLVIVGVLLIVGVPQIARFSANSKLRSRVDVLVKDLELAHSNATSGAARVQSNFTLFAIFKEANSNPTGPQPSGYTVFSVAQNGFPGTELRSDAVEPEITVTMTGAPQSTGKFDATAVSGLEMAVNGVSPHQVLVYKANGTLEINSTVSIRLNNKVQQFRIDVSRLGAVTVTPEPPGTGS